MEALLPALWLTSGFGAGDARPDLIDGIRFSSSPVIAVPGTVPRDASRREDVQARHMDADRRAGLPSASAIERQIKPG